ncbi:MAG: peptidoglycan-N-acetylglucosamine deacetylase [Actinomycetota bacterium]|nr:peptidoglycan-N-acetylglucosamine deacetylase [Actinomycetota bacterium]
MLGERERAVVIAVLAGVVAMVTVWGRAPQADSDTTDALRLAHSPVAGKTDEARPPASSQPGRRPDAQDGAKQDDSSRDPRNDDEDPDGTRPTGPTSVTPTVPRPVESPEATSPVTTSSPAGEPGPTTETDFSARLSGDCPEAIEGLHSRAPGSGPTIALTFDDGPGPYTSQVLDVLAREDVPATFFVTGRNVSKNPDLVARATREGHLVANHTWDHEYPDEVEGGWTVRYLKEQLVRTSNAVVEAGGERTCWFRPPGGSAPPNLQPVAAALRMSIALWSVDTEDWKIQADGDAEGISWKIFMAALTTTQRHPVVLLHDGGGFRGATAAALPRIIDWYQDRGYTFVRLDGRG